MMTTAVGLSDGRISAPEGMSPEEARVWRTTIDSKPAEWFGQEHVHILSAYCQVVVEAERMRKTLAGLDVMADAVQYDRIAKLANAATQMVITYARSMRLTHQAQMRASKAGSLSNRPSGRRPWDDA